MMNSFKISVRNMALAFMGLTAALTACNPEPDESDLYTFTGETIESLIAADSSCTSFNYILKRVGYDRLMAAYGTYTCFAPSNEGVDFYIDSLYNDSVAHIPHNGMTDNSLEGLTDSLCLLIARYHLMNTVETSTSLATSTSVSSMLGDRIDLTFDSIGRSVLSSKATIVSSDNEATNGVLHLIDHVIPRVNRKAMEIFEGLEDYKIFTEALRLTHLYDSLEESLKPYTYVMSTTRHTSRNTTLNGPTQCKVGFTIFAQTDKVLADSGIHNIDDLIAYANKVYKDATDWYDYMRENKITVSTGTDYEQRNNALNMYVAYHILYASMKSDELLFERGDKPISQSYWNYGDDADLYDYYETMLPHTVMKIWSPRKLWTNSRRGPIYINRYQKNNTLTDQLYSVEVSGDTRTCYGSMGSDAIHEVVFEGVEVERKDIKVSNAYIHPVKGTLKYDRMVARGTLNERIRIDACTMLPELINNELRSTPSGTASNIYGNAYVAIPTEAIDPETGQKISMPYFRNSRIYSGMGETVLCYNTHSANRCYQSDQLQIYGSKYDIAFKLLPVPSGQYEIRVVAPLLSYGSIAQFYLGTSSNPQSMTALGIPFDLTQEATSPSIGWTDAKIEEDFGVTTDVAMRNRGYMRGPYSFCGHAENGWSTTNNARFEGGYGTSLIRRILGTVTIEQGKEAWLRIKCRKEGNSLMMFDFVELVPVGLLNSQEYLEDWY